MTLLLALTLSAAPLAFSALPLPASAAPARHTSHHAAPAPAMQDSSEAIDLFSDTTGIDTAFDDPVFTHHADDDDDEGFARDILRDLFKGGFGVGATLVALAAVLMAGLFFLAPLIIVVLIVWYLIKRRNQRIQLAQKAMETGQPIPSEALPEERQTDEYMWRHGIRTAFLGLGLTVMFALWDADFLTGIGALVMFYGVGQLVIAKWSPSRRPEKGDPKPRQDEPRQETKKEDTL